MSFIKEVATAAVRIGKKYNILPSLILAQACLESNFGRSGLAVQGKNLFGVKGTYEGQGVTMFKNTVGSMIAGKAFGFPIGISGALGFASSFIKFSSEFSIKPKEIPDGLKDYAYLYYAHNELV